MGYSVVGYSVVMAGQPPPTGKNHVKNGYLKADILGLRILPYYENGIAAAYFGVAKKFFTAKNASTGRSYNP